MRQFLGLGLLLALAAPTIAADPPAPATLLDRAKAAGDAYQVTEARRLYAEAVGEARRSGGVSLAAALREQGHYLGTLRLLREAEAALPEALRKRGSAHNAAGNFAEFTKDYDRAQELGRGAGR